MAEEYRNGSCPENISVQKTPDGSTLFLIKTRLLRESEYMNIHLPSGRKKSR